MNAGIGPNGTGAPADPPVLWTEPFGLTRVDVAAAMFDGRAVIGLVAMATVVLALGLATRPVDEVLTTAAIVLVVWIAVVAAYIAQRPAAATEPRSFELWADGRYRFRFTESQWDSSLGETGRTSRSRFGWRLRVRGVGALLIPARALTPDQDRYIAQLVAARPTAITRDAEYRTDVWSTLPFDRTLADLVPVLVRRLAPGTLLLYPLWVVILRSARFTLPVAFVGAAIVVCIPFVTVLLVFVRTVRLPDAHALRMVIRQDGVEIHSQASSTFIAASAIKKVSTTRHAIVMHLHQPWVIPARAFRDDAHRQHVLDWLRWLAAQPR